jgi:hypothetical protein
MMQQMPPMAAYSDQAAQMLANKPSDAMSADPSAFAKKELDDIAAKLMNVAKVLSQTKKELMPLVQKMAEAGSMLSNELQSAAVPPAPAGGPAPEEQAPVAPPQAQGPGGMGLGA